jgi:hypothetical protein
LTEAQARFEMRNWDEVWLEGIADARQELSDGAHYVLIGNNAGQGLPLARSLSKTHDRLRCDYLRPKPAGATRI